jgi:aminopeptidase N
MKFLVLITTLSLLLITIGVEWACAQDRRFPAPSPTKCRLPVEMLVENPAFFKGPTATDYPPPPSDDRGYDVLSYDLDIELFPDTRTISGTVDIGLVALATGKNRVRLDLVDELTCDGVTFRGLETHFTHAGDSLVVNLDSDLATAGADTVSVRWHGRPPSHGNFRTGLMFRTHDNGTPDDPNDDQPIIANQNQPWSAHSWWPCKDHPSDKALFSIRTTVPEPLVVISNGTLIREDAPGPGLRRFAWREAYPMATYLVSVAVTHFASGSESCDPGTGGPVRLDYHVFPQHRGNAEVDLARTCDMLELMTRLAGPYPFIGEKYAQAEFKWVGSMEHQTATSLSPIVFSGDGRYELVVIHELAHQWFGDSLTPEVWADIWLNEGFARYFEALWVEHAYGLPEYQEYMRLIGPVRHPDLFVNDGVLSDPDPILPNSLVYDKGAWVLHMLRMLIGEEAFVGFLADYAADPELVLGSVTLDDMIGAAETAAGRDLSGFFGPWLDTAEVPTLNMSMKRTDSGPSGNGVALRFTQHQTPVFEFALPLVIHTSCGDLHETVVLSRYRQDFSWNTPCPVESVSVDPDSMVLMKWASDAPPVIQVKGPWPNPVQGIEAEFRIYLTSDLQVVAKLYDGRGRLLEKTDLGTLATTGPADDPETMPHIWTWPGATTGSARIPTGIYWLEFSAGDARAVRKLTLLH